MTYRKFFMLFVGLLTCYPVLCQQIGERDVALQEKFIDANRERIVGNIEKAIPLFEEVLRQDPTNAAAAYELARIYDDRDDNEKALRYIRMAISASPSNLWYYRLLGDIYQKQGKNREAAALYEDLVKREPLNDYYYYRWAYFLIRADDIAKALKVYDDLEKRVGVSEDIIRRKYSLYVGMGNNKKAATELQRLIAAYPNNIEYRHLLAGFYEQIGETGLSRVEYKKILDLAPDDARANIALAGTPDKQHNEIQFLASLRPVFNNADIPIDQKIGKIMPIIAKVADTGNRELAEATLELTTLLETVHPTDAKGFAASGDLLYYSGNRLRALDKYKKTLELDDTVFLVWEQLLRIYLDMKDYVSLRKYSDEAIDIFPNKALLHYMNGVANYGLKRHSEALSAFEEAILMVGNNGRLLYDIQVHKGLTLHAQKKSSASNEAFEAALKLNAKAPEALHYYSFCLASRGETIEKAQNMAKQANELAPDRADFQTNYGWVLYKAKNYTDARHWFDKALNNGGMDDPELLEHYGDLLFQMNDADGALQYWLRAQEKGGMSETLEKKIANRKLYD